MYLHLSQVAGGAASTLSTQTLHPPKFTHPIPPLFSNRRPKFLATTTSLSILRTVVVNADVTNKSKPATASFTGSEDQPISIVSQENVPLEGVIQFEKPDTNSRFRRWGHVALLSGGDVLAILLFSAIGRFSHGFSVFDAETLRTADPFIAGWFLSAYFLGGYGEDGRGVNGKSKAITAAVKSWALGVPLGIFIRAASVGHIPPTRFIAVTMGSTALLLVGWRALLSNLLVDDKSKKNDIYKRGSAFELFEVSKLELRLCRNFSFRGCSTNLLPELLTSLVRRW
ncbi:Protein of unknown function DUF3054 [Cynara cardunculus var. scolymus]|uniref:Transmembrane protein n=1 Tax=Cynara cardunculus var. scolymus TaxID=59895 RepID=A0A118K407_CYNCS|nr:Protein of unknown function DUF3054 [Cynara cardunculus var. scolymus]